MYRFSKRVRGRLELTHELQYDDDDDDAIARIRNGHLCLVKRGDAKTKIVDLATGRALLRWQKLYKVEPDESIIAVDMDKEHVFLVSQTAKREPVKRSGTAYYLRKASVLRVVSRKDGRQIWSVTGDEVSNFSKIYHHDIHSLTHVRDFTWLPTQFVVRRNWQGSHRPDLWSQLECVDTSIFLLSDDVVVCIPHYSTILQDRAKVLQPLCFTHNSPRALMQSLADLPVSSLAACRGWVAWNLADRLYLLNLRSLDSPSDSLSAQCFGLNHDTDRYRLVHFAQCPSLYMDQTCLVGSAVTFQILASGMLSSFGEGEIDLAGGGTLDFGTLVNFDFGKSPSVNEGTQSQIFPLPSTEVCIGRAETLDDLDIYVSHDLWQEGDAPRSWNRLKDDVPDETPEERKAHIDNMYYEDVDENSDLTDDDEGEM